MLTSAIALTEFYCVWVRHPAQTGIFSGASVTSAPPAPSTEWWMDDGPSEPKVSPPQPACAQTHRAGFCFRSHSNLFLWVICFLPQLSRRLVPVSMLIWGPDVPLALYHLPAELPPLILAACWESPRAWAFVCTLQLFKSFLSWQSFPSSCHTPGVNSGPGPNPSGPLHGLMGVRRGLLMTIRLKLWLQLDPLPFCPPPTPLQACQKANQLSHSWAQQHHKRNQQSERKLAHSTERHLEQAGSPKAPGRPGKGPPRLSLCCPLSYCHSMERLALRT